MPTVTICIPAYQAEGFVAHTVRSALAQTYTDIVVDVAIEPPGLGELAACEPLMQDKRLRVSVNDVVLGWAENIAAMLKRVRTPYYLILPHDDFLHRRYVEVLLAAVENRSDALLAYGDIQFMSGGFPQRRRQVLSEGGLADRLISFLAAGAEAPIWRGVTRTDRLGDEFPTDNYRGLLVETEWAFHLLTRGVAVRAPRTLYFKRFFGEERMTASRTRHNETAEKLREGVEDHYRRMLGRADAAFAGAVPELALHGLQSIRAKRLLEHGIAEFGVEVHAALDAAASGCERIGSAHALTIMANILTAQSRAAELSGNADDALRLAKRAAGADPQNAPVQTQLARVLHAVGDRFGALQAIVAACDADPYALGTRELTAQIEVDFLNGLKG